MSSPPSVRTIAEGHVSLHTLLRHVTTAGLVIIAATILLQSAWVMAPPASAQGGTQLPEGSPATPAERLDFPVFVRAATGRGGRARHQRRHHQAGPDESRAAPDRHRTRPDAGGVGAVHRRLCDPATDPPGVRTARANATKHKALLARVHDKYGVSPRFIVAIWGLESNFGRFSGVRPTDSGAGDACMGGPARPVLSRAS